MIRTRGWMEEAFNPCISCEHYRDDPVTYAVCQFQCRGGNTGAPQDPYVAWQKRCINAGRTQEEVDACARKGVAGGWNHPPQPPRQQFGGAPAPYNGVNYIKCAPAPKSACGCICLGDVDPSRFWARNQDELGTIPPARMTPEQCAEQPYRYTGPPHRYHEFKRGLQLPRSAR